MALWYPEPLGHLKGKRKQPPTRGAYNQVVVRSPVQKNEKKNPKCLDKHVPPRELETVRKCQVTATKQKEPRRMRQGDIVSSFP